MSNIIKNCNYRDMKKVLLFVCAIFVGYTSNFAQTKPSAPILDQSSAAVLSLALNRLGIDIYLNGGSYIYKMDSTVVASAAKGNYSSFISKALKSIEFEYSHPDYLSPIPIKFSGADCLVFMFSTSSVFNENKFSDRELAQRICSDMILPDFYRMYDAFEEKCPKYIGIGVTYKTKDFSEKYDTGDNHSLMIISSKENIWKFITYEITDNKFLENSFILLFKESNGKRIELQF